MHGKSYNVCTLFWIDFWNRVRYPFDWKSPIGFFGCFFIQLSSVYIFVEIYTCAIVLTVGFCSFLADFATDIEQKLLQLNEYVLELKGKKKLTVEERNELKKKMIDIFCFHSEARELSINIFNEKNILLILYFIFLQIHNPFLQCKQ